MEELKPEDLKKMEERRARRKAQAIEQKKQNKKALKKIFFFSFICIALGVAYAAYWELYASKFEETENAYVSAHQNIVTSQIGGNIVEMNIEDTQSVTKGLVAIKIENIDYKLAVDRARNDLAHAVRGVKGLQNNENQSVENLSLKQLDLNKSRDDYLRDKKAFDAGVLSQEQLDSTRHRMDQSRLALESASTGLKNSKIQAFTTNLEDHPDVAKAINQFKQASIDFKRTEITVPTNGIIAKKSAYIGQRVSPTQVLFSVIDTAVEWVDANFKESQLKNIKIGQHVELHSDVNNKKYQGYISGIGAGSGSALSLLPAQNATGNWIKIVQRVPVRINILPESLEKNGLLPIGTSVLAKVTIDKVLTTTPPAEQKVEIFYDEEGINKEVKKIIEENSGK